MFNQPKERIALFIDGSNMYYLTRALNWRVDFIKFRNHFQNRNTYLAYAGYYTAIEVQPDGTRPIQPLVDFLSDHGFTLVTKLTKAYAQHDGSMKVKGNVDVDLALDALEMCQYVDRVVLVTGDGDFATLAKRIQMKGRQVTVVSSRSANMLSGELRKAATNVIDLADIRNEISAD